MGRFVVQKVVTTKVLVALLMGSAAAQVSRDWMVCTGKLPAAPPDESVAACTAIIEARTETPANLAVAYCSRGVAHHARDRLDRALLDYQEAVRIAPKSPTGYLCGGYANLARGTLDDAIADFNEAIARQPQSSSTFIGRGRAYRAKRRTRSGSRRL